MYKTKISFQNYVIYYFYQVGVGDLTGNIPLISCFFYFELQFYFYYSIKYCVEQCFCRRKKEWKNGRILVSFLRKDIVNENDEKQNNLDNLA